MFSWAMITSGAFWYSKKDMITLVYDEFIWPLYLGRSALE